MSKIISFREKFYESDEEPYHIYPHNPVLSFIATFIRSIYRRCFYFVYTLLLNLFLVCFCHSSRLVILQRLHTTDAVEAIKPD